MEIRFEGVVEGKRLYRVFARDGETVLFVGTNQQCQRFIEIHEAKVEHDRLRERPRRRSAETAR